MLTLVSGEGSGHEGGKEPATSLIDEIVREGARRMLGRGAEADAYIARERDENGRRLVVRSGYHRPREVLTSAGAIEVRAPRVNGKRTDSAKGEWMRFSLAIPPRAGRRGRSTEEAAELSSLPIDYPAGHWVHLRAASRIESTFATVRRHKKVTTGSGSRAAGLAMAFKLIELAMTAGTMNVPYRAAMVRVGHLDQKQTRRTTPARTPSPKPLKRS